MNPSDTRRNIIKRLAQLIVSMVVIAAVLFLTAGTIKWVYAWLYLGVSILVMAVNALLFPPELISERGRKKENVEPWDRIVTTLLIIPWLGVYAVAGLDHRLHWSNQFSAWLHIIGIFAYLVGNAFVSWAMISNNYFSTAVRIQYDRGHGVASGGPYRYVRHPGYLGMIIYHISTPLFLGSLWAFVPVALTVILFVVRTIFEDATLRNKLGGYKEYAERVKYRLIPGVL